MIASKETPRWMKPYIKTIRTCCVKMCQSIEFVLKPKDWLVLFGWFFLSVFAFLLFHSITVRLLVNPFRLWLLIAGPLRSTWCIRMIPRYDSTVSSGVDVQVSSQAIERTDSWASLSNCICNWAAYDFLSTIWISIWAVPLICLSNSYHICLSMGVVHNPFTN